MNKEERIDFSVKSTIGLHHLNDKMQPDGIASGCIINYLDKRFILTVAHAVASGGWALRLEITPNALQKYYRAQYTLISHGLLNIAAIERSEENPFDLMLNPKLVDFAFTELPKEYEVYDEYLDWNAKLKYYRPKHEYLTNLENIPEAGKCYSFYGETRLNINPGKKQIITTPKYVTNVQYLFSKDEFHIFQLPFTVTDPKELKGCSGAPIFDENGVLVALVVGCYTNTNRLVGINLNKYKFIIDIENGVYK